MAQTVVGLFDDAAHAQRAVKDLIASSFATDRVSIITSDPQGEFSQYSVDKHGNKAAQGAATGAVSGALVGGTLGLLVGLGLLFVPVAAPVAGLLAAGPIATTLTGAGVGAVGGGLLGGLIGLGIPEHHAHTYAEAIRRGSVLVAVEVNDMDVVKANDIMKRHGAVDVHQREAYYRQQGFTQYDPSSQPYTAEQVAQERERLRNYYGSTNAGMTGSPAMATGGMVAPNATTTTMADDSVMRSRYSEHANQGITYEQWEPAYRFGWGLANNPAYQNWQQSEPMIRQQWEQANPGSYVIYREAIYAGFDDAFARRSGPKMM